MATWGVLRLPAGADAAAGAGDGAVAAGIAAHLDGLVAVAADLPLKGVLDSLPARVTRIVELDPTTATDLGSGELVAALLAADDGAHPAIVTARPLADALKRVEGDVVVEGLLRDGLFTPQLPSVLDRATLEQVADATGLDGVALVLGAGYPVRVVPVDGEPVTVRAAGTTR